MAIGCYIYFNIIDRFWSMIKNKYARLQTLKQRHGKIVEKAVNKIDGKQVILKSYPKEDAKSIENQLEVYRNLKEPHLYGFPEIKEGFVFEDRLYLVFQELGKDLDYLRQICGGRFTLKTTLMAGLQMLERIQFLHESGFLHGDIKPSNFLIGKSGKLKHKIYLIDFQLSHPYLDKTGKHIKDDHVQTFSGCLRFCGVGPNSQKKLCRRDQMQSWLYCLIFFLKGELPWMNVKAENMSEAYNLIGAIKKQKQQQLIQGLPQIFSQILKNITSQKFQDKPNYGLYRREMLNLMKKNGYELDYKNDWDYL